MTELTSQASDHAYFFLGNCQMQYLCSVLGSVTSAPRYTLGQPFNVNVTLDGARVHYMKGSEFLKSAREMSARGGRNILLVQDTKQRRYYDRVARWGDLFSDVLLFPLLHHSSLWPGRTLNKPIDAIPARTMRRLGEWEQHEFAVKLSRCGGDPKAFAPDYWERNRQTLRFFHPGHPVGEVFAEVLEALSEPLAAKLPCYQDLTMAFRRTMGIYQTCSHPIRPEVADAQDIEWARSDLYRSWTRVVYADPEHRRRAVDEASEILRSPELMATQSWPIQAHFRAAVGKANLALGRRRRALAQLQQSVIELKGFHPLLRIAIELAVHAGRYNVVEQMLVEVAPHVVGVRPEHAGPSAVLSAVNTTPQGRATLLRVRDQIAPDTWMYGKIQSLQAGD